MLETYSIADGLQEFLKYLLLAVRCKGIETHAVNRAKLLLF